MRKTLAIFVLILSLVAGLPAHAQTSQGRILGLVGDQSGAVIPGAKVTITNTATGVARSLTTTNAGEYIAPNLEPGPYSVTVEAPGFEKLQRTGLELEVARDIRVDAKMLPGSVSTTVEITGETPVINTSNDVLGTTFSNTAINELPLQGRDFQNLVTLQPGVQRSPGGGLLSINANGNRAEANNFIIDGTDDNDAYYGDTVVNAAGVEGTPATHLPIDAIQEFNVQSSPEADYGNKPGAIINLGIKSGTNAFHGTAYYFHRNSALDARNWFNQAGTPISALRLHQFGASAGGPILKDKLFIFGNYEGVRDVVGNPLQISTPITTPIGDPTSSLADAIAECQAAATCSPISLSLAKYFLPNPGGTTGSSDPTLINTDFNNLNREDNGILKLDYHATERNAFNATYFIGDSLQTEEDSNVVQPYFLSTAGTRAQLIGGSWIFSGSERFTNQLHVGYNRFWQQLFTADHAVNPTTYGINTGVTNPNDFGMPEIRISGFNSHTLGGNGSWPLFTTPNQTYVFTDNASYLKGAHNFRFGGEYRWGNSDNTRDDLGKGEIRFRNSSTGSALENFTTGNPYQGQIFVGNSHRYVSQSTWGLFVQDTWHLRNNFTVSWGLRYDLSLPVKERNNLLGNFDPNTGLVQVGKQISQPYQTDNNNLAPRLSFLYDPTGTGRTIFRAGGGIIYEVPHISIFIGQNGASAEGLGVIPTGAQGVTPGGGTIVANTLTLDSSQVTSNWQSGGPVFGNLDPSLISCSPDTPCPILGVNPRLVTPYVINWNFNMEQALWRNSAATIAYVGNKGNKLYSLRDINQNDYAIDQANNADEQSGRPFNTPFPYLSYIDQLGNGDNSIYHALQVTMKQQATNGLYFVAGYTWAHAIDDSSGNRTFDIQNSYDPAAERSNAAFDIRNRFTLAMTYEPPARKGHAQLLSGWRLNNIFTAQDGEPVFFYDSSNDISGTGEFNDRWALHGDPRNIRWSNSHGIGYVSDGTTSAACVQADPEGVANGQLASYGCYSGPGYSITPPQPGNFGTMGREVVSGPGYFDWDFSLIKTFSYADRYHLELRGEVFNIINHPNFADLDHDLSDGSTVGIPQYTPDVAASNPVVGSGGSRHIQVGAKIRW